ncbi:MAG: hypoxanthine phosphoribosyltransferase [Lachnospiraceae bacterium]|nr:hypoxanthine phosphoribosyltransferase [Lachnospiraceae bacterium]
MKENVSILISQQELEARIEKMAEQINRDYEGESVHLICILKGSAFFTCELAKHLDIPVTMDFMAVSSYGSQTKSSGVVRLIKDLDEPIEGRNVIVIEDIIDSGRTLSYLLDNLSGRGPKTLRLAALLDKPDRRVTDVGVDYTGFVIPDKFVVGFGLDFDQRYRNLPYIGVMSFEE